MNTKPAKKAKRSAAPGMPVVLSIAGSDSGGGAGIQADLAAFAAIGVFGTTAVTCVTAQNPGNVGGIARLSPRMVALQIKMVCDAFPVAAAKTGMLYSEPIIRAVARSLAGRRFAGLVVDPVMFSTSGVALLREDAVKAACSLILPEATVITPNIPEAQVLAGGTIASLPDMQAAAEAIGRIFETAVVVKGGHMKGRTVANVLYDRGAMRVFRMPRAGKGSPHGTGCMFSAAIAAFLALRCGLADAVERAGMFTARAVAAARRCGRYRVLNPGK